MICKKLKFKKQIMSLMLTAVMTVSAVDSMGIRTYADSNNDVAAASATVQDVQTDSTRHATGFLGEDSDGGKVDCAISTDEFEKIVNSDRSKANDVVPMAASAYPASVDNSESEYFPAIGDQDRVGSCVCWGEVYYAFTYANCKAKGIPATGANVFSPAFVYNQVKCSGGGTWSESVIKVLLTEGAPSFETVDFETYSNDASNRSWFPVKSVWQEAEKTRLTSYVSISNPGQITSPDDDDLNQIKSYLSQGYLVTFACTMYGWEYGRIPSGSAHAGEWITTGAHTDEGGHVMTIVGYDDNIYFDVNNDGVIQDAERGALKIANSWGTSYKNDGFCWVLYDALNGTSAAGAPSNVNGKRRISAMRSFYTQYVAPGGTKGSGIDVVMELNTASRSEDRITIIAKDASNNTFSNAVTATNSDNFLSYSLDGKTYATDGTITFDLNNVISNITKDKVKDYTWYVYVSDYYNNNSPLTLKKAYIECNGAILAEYSGNNVTIDGNSSQVELESVANKPVEIREFTVSKPGKASITDNVVLKADAQYGSGEYEYRFGTIYNGTTHYNRQNGEYSDYNTLDTILYRLAYNSDPTKYTITPGNNTLFVDVRDKVTGKTARKTIENYVIEGMKVSKLTATTANGKFEKGKEITIAATVENEAGYRYNPRSFYCSYNGGEFVFLNPHGPGSEYSFRYTPDKDGKYTFKYEITDFIGQSATKTVDVYVGGKQAVVYYNNPQWYTANIHYCVDGGSWTNVPGVHMQASDVEGYAWKYVIDLGNANGANVCFNNDNNWWDSRNGANYYVGAGVYGIKDGQINELSLSATMTFVGEVGSKSAYVTMTNGTGPYTIEYKAYKDNELQYSSTAHTYGNSDYAYLSFSLYYEGLYRVDATITDANGQVCTVSHEEYFPGLIINLTPDKEGDYTVGEEVTVTCSFENFFYYKFPPRTLWYVTKDGVSVPSTVTGNELKFTPTQAGTYTVTYDIPEYQLGAQSKSITINVKDNSNKVVVYYNNSNWSNANIHYGINGSWTNVPGVQMSASDNPRYTWKYVIDLGDASSVQVCFNNGNGSWDSRNGANYTLTAGSYSIVNGQIYNA